MTPQSDLIEALRVITERKAAVAGVAPGPGEATVIGTDGTRMLFVGLDVDVDLALSIALLLGHDREKVAHALIRQGFPPGEIIANTVAGAFTEGLAVGLVMADQRAKAGTP